MNRHRIAGLRGAITVLRRAVAANEEDIAHGHKFEHYLAENRRKLSVAERKLENALTLDLGGRQQSESRIHRAGPPS